MFSILTFCLFVAALAEEKKLLFCDDDKSVGTSCARLGVSNCESIDMCELITDQLGSYCRCKESLGFFKRTSCRVFGFDCRDFNEPIVGTTTEKCPTDVCQLKQLVGEAKDSFEKFRHRVEHHGCVAYASDSAQESRMGICVDKPRDFLEEKLDNVCTHVKEGITAQGGIDRAYRGDESAACGEEFVCCLPQRETDPSGLTSFLNPDAVYVKSPTRLDYDYGRNYFLGETVDLTFHYPSNLRGKTVEVRVVEDRNESKVHITKTATLSSGSKYEGKIDLMSNTLLPGERYQVAMAEVVDGTAVAYKTVSDSFIIASPPCFASVRNEFQDSKQEDFGGLCVQSEIICSVKNFGTSRKWFPGKHCKNVEGFEDFGCCVPHNGFASVGFREQEQSTGAASAIALSTSAAFVVATLLF